MLRWIAEHPAQVLIIIVVVIAIALVGVAREKND
jgi:hypothetical protein